MVAFAENKKVLVAETRQPIGLGVLGALCVENCGYRYDPESKNYYVRNRYYAPALGRWLTRDPIGYRGGINLYGYVQSSPVAALDPLGSAFVSPGYPGDDPLPPPDEFTPEAAAALEALIAALSDIAWLFPAAAAALAVALAAYGAWWSACAKGRQIYLDADCDIAHPTQANHPHAAQQAWYTVAKCVRLEPTCNPDCPSELSIGGLG